MATSITLPALGESVTEGTVTRWLKSVGEHVAVDEPLLEVSTDKVDTEIPSPVAGILVEIKAQEDETVEVGAELALIDSEASLARQESETEPANPVAHEPSPGTATSLDPVPDRAPVAAPTATHARAAAPIAEKNALSPSPAARPQDEGGGYTTPLVRKLASAEGVDLATVTGTGVGGRVRKQDVLDAAVAQRSSDAAPVETAPAASPETTSAASVALSDLRGRTEPLTRLRKVIASRMVESLQTSAQLTQVVEVDVTLIGRLRDSVKADFLAREGVKLSFFPFFAKATADVLKAHPTLNATIDTDKGEVTYFDHEHLSIAVDTPRGLLTPVIQNAGDLNVAGLARRIADLAERTRSNKISPDELYGGTFTLTNTGSVGALFDTPIINQPQVAILGTGTVVKRPVVIDDPNLGETIAIRQMMYLCLTYDHRLVDGADAARFLQDVKGRLQTGQFEV